MFITGHSGKEGVRYESAMRAFVVENNAALPLPVSRKGHPPPHPLHQSVWSGSSHPFSFESLSFPSKICIKGP